MDLKRILRGILPYELVRLHQKSRECPAAALPSIDPTPPAVYTCAGEPIHTFYLQDEMTPTYPYSFVYGALPRHILWDRFNYGLQTQFYSHNETMRLKPGTPKKRFAYFIESEVITPDSYERFDQTNGLANEFTAVFTHSEAQLNRFPNAKFCPGGGVWYGTAYGGGAWDDTRWMKKTKNVSIVSSFKAACPLHVWRTEQARVLSRDNLADAYGTFDGGDRIRISESLDDYRYSVAVENCVTGYYFTEKILNCFAAMTVPVYVGARHIGKFFNPDGIIQISPDAPDALPQALRGCSAEDYRDRLPAILDNYARVKKYRVIEDWLYETYGSLLY